MTDGNERQVARARTATLSIVFVAAVLGLQFSAAARAAADATPTAPAPVSPASSEQTLANQVNNPTAPLTTLQLRDIYAPTASLPYTRNIFQLQPVIPIGPFDWLPFVQLMKITMPFVETTPGADGETGMGDLTLFDLASIKQSWGRWGVGPYLVAPTATGNRLGAGKVQLGPSVGLIYTVIENLVAGAVLQNPISFAGQRSRPTVHQLIVSPTLTYNLPEGWFAGLTDFSWTFNWRASGSDVPLVPLGLQIGRVVRIGKQPVSLSVEAARAAWKPESGPNPGWIIGFAITPIFNFHIGPGEKIKLRGNAE
jgi:hypothetical protein